MKEVAAAEEAAEEAAECHAKVEVDRKAAAGVAVEQKMTKKQRLTNDDQQLDREMSRGATLEVITKLAEAKKMQCALEVSLST